MALFACPRCHGVLEGLIVTTEEYVSITDCGIHDSNDVISEKYSCPSCGKPLDVEFDWDGTIAIVKGA